MSYCPLNMEGLFWFFFLPNMLFSVCSRRRIDRDGSENRSRVNALGRVRLRGNISTALPSARHSTLTYHSTATLPSLWSRGDKVFANTTEIKLLFCLKVQFFLWVLLFLRFFVCRKGPELNICFPKFPHYIFYGFIFVLGFSFQIPWCSVTGTILWCIHSASACWRLIVT